MIKLERVIRELKQSAIDRVVDQQLSRLNKQSDPEEDILKKLLGEESEEEQEDLSFTVALSPDNYSEDDYTYTTYEFYIDPFKVEDLTQLKWCCEIVKTSKDVVQVVESAEEVSNKIVAYKEKKAYLYNNKINKP